MSEPTKPASPPLLAERTGSEAIESALGRPVWTHELAMDREGIWQELVGERESPTMQQILEIIPKEKRIIVAHP